MSAGKYIAQFGSAYPLIKINGYGPFSKDEILEFTIYQTSFLPKCSFKLQLKEGIFLSTSFPKDNDVINVYIRSLNDQHKTIRNDYVITNVSSNRSQDSEGDNLILYISGELYVPNLNSMFIKSWNGKTSFEVLFDIATQLKLGFVSNEKVSDLKDQQIWLSPNYTYLKMIEYVTEHSFSNLDSFYISFIDYYYNLNFINLGPLFSVPMDHETEEGIMRGAFNIDDSLTDDFTVSKQPIILSNAKELKSSNYYFNSFNIINKSGFINEDFGHFPNISFYDKKEKKFWNFDISPLITQGSEKENVVMLGRSNEDYYKNNKKPFYLGVQYLYPEHNCHAYYKQAPLQNKYNLEFASKMQIDIHLPLFNFNLYRCQNIPVQFMVTNSDNRGKVAGKAVDDKSQKLGWTVDRFLTGRYVIYGLTIEYKQDVLEKLARPNAATDGIWTVSLNLRRREWSMPDVKNKKEDDKDKSN
jgi:hypothetical protein